MFSYSLFQWFALFAIYCFLGWGFESIYVSIEHRKLVNRGFLNGPFLPIYGFGAIIILIFSLPVRNNIVLVFVFGSIGATILEYFTGYVMEQLFHVRYWDYTCQPLNLNGFICLGCSLMWGGLSVVLTKFLHKPIEKFILKTTEDQILIFDIVFLIYFVIDMYLSTKAAFDLRKIIDEQIRNNEKVLRLQKRLDVLIAVIDDDIDQLQNRFSGEKAEFEQLIAETKEKWANKITEAKEEASNLRQQIENLPNLFNKVTKKRILHAMNILKRNPAVFSARHKLSKEQIRTIFKDLINKK